MHGGTADVYLNPSLSIGTCIGCVLLVSDEKGHKQQILFTPSLFFFRAVSVADITQSFSFAANETGWNITADEQLEYNKWIADQVRGRRKRGGRGVYSCNGILWSLR